MANIPLDVIPKRRLRDSRLNNVKVIFVLLNVFWYLSLFPGRLGFDYSEAIRMMHRGESTNWWTSEFWWYLKITTFNGRFLFISSLISLLIFSTSIYFFVQSLPLRKMIKERTLLIFCCSPIFGGFALNVSHDVFQAAGIILFTSIQLRQHLQIQVRRKIAIELIAACLVMTTAIGPLIVGTYIFVLLFQKCYLRSIMTIIVAVFFAISSAFGVTEVPRLGFALTIFGDIKCIVQHPDVELSSEDWKTLEIVASKELWMSPKPCSLVDVQIEDFNIKKVESAALTASLVKLYAKLISENPAIFIISHFQKSSQALPPPFFHGPSNQIDLNPNVPLGIKTNTALQEGTELLHPSVDEQSVDMNVGVLKPLEVVAQIGILIVNQASWFWGWGGLWLWPILIFGLYVLNIRKLKDWIKIFMPTLTLHSFLIIVLSAPQGRYVMSTITMGIVLLIALIVQNLSKTSGEK